MGPSGSGKTTLLSILGCILTPTVGHAPRCRRMPRRGLTPERAGGAAPQHIGFIFQSYNLFPTLTAQENVRIALDVRGEGLRRRRRVPQRCCARSACATLKSLSRQLVGGEQQRVAVARAHRGVAVGPAGGRAYRGARQRERARGDAAAGPNRQGQQPQRARRHPRSHAPSVMPTACCASRTA